MGWFSSVPILLLVLFLLQVVQTSGTNDSAHMQEMAGVNKMITNKRSGGGRSGGGRSGGGGRGGSSDNGGGRGSDGNSNTPDGRLIPLLGGGLAGSRNGAAAGHRKHNAASSTCSSFLPTLLATTALEAVFLAL
uniref:Serine, glycine, tyrosine and glutamine-rich protein n=1 Tax=Elaeis guineensis var. tenera TaxID=51953 RepID=A0A6I9SQD0_ELAGV|nr:serine, glycine, tyrosine and glutamine-rich protein [Elaeis guineensis]